MRGSIFPLSVSCLCYQIFLTVNVDLAPFKKYKNYLKCHHPKILCLPCLLFSYQFKFFFFFHTPISLLFLACKNDTITNDGLYP